MRSRALGFAVVTALAVFALVGCTKRSAEDIPVLGQLPKFSLVDQNEQTFDRASMEDRLSVSAFVFTHCRSSCPRITAHMKGLQSRLSDVSSVQFVSVSVDPRNDTPEVIKAYMTKNELDESNWRFVTGEEEVIRRVVVDGFRVGLGDADSKAAGAEEIMHSNSFVLVDQEAQVRGYYRANNDGIGDLERDLRALTAVTAPKR
ncbi:MAG: SCO family protein [Myxococcales bacterium]|nr:SCO family protein [Myxococcales bacterium]NNK42215.1 SCO family protein [Myxococcales bacterium]